MMQRLQDIEESMAYMIAYKGCIGGQEYTMMLGIMWILVRPTRFIPRYDIEMDSSQHIRCVFIFSEFFI
jgi:hypothetical protein